MPRKRELPVVNASPGGDGIGRREVLQGLLAGVGAAIPGAALASPSPAQAAALQAAAAKAAAADWTPEFLDAHQMATLQALCERIVPGSTQARADRFIDSLLAVDRRPNVLVEERRPGQERFLSALGAIDAESRRRFGKPFPSVTEAQQVEVLTAAANEKPGKEDWIWTPGTPVKRPEPRAPVTTLRDHFDYVKGTIVGAFYSSESGLKELGSTGQMFFASFPDCDHEGGHSD